MKSLSEKQIRELRQTVAELLPDSVIVLGNLEHQIDLVSGIVKDLSLAIKEIDPSILPEGFDKKLELLDKFLTQSSLDFKNLDHFLYNELVNGAVSMKQYIRFIQLRYFKEQGIDVPLMK